MTNYISKIHNQCQSYFSEKYTFSSQLLYESSITSIMYEITNVQHYKGKLRNYTRNTHKTVVQNRTLSAHLQHQYITYPQSVEASKNVEEWSLFNKSSLAHLLPRQRFTRLLPYTFQVLNTYTWQTAAHPPILILLPERTFDICKFRTCAINHLKYPTQYIQPVLVKKPTWGLTRKLEASSNGHFRWVKHRSDLTRASTFYIKFHTNCVGHYTNNVAVISKVRRTVHRASKARRRCTRQCLTRRVPKFPSICALDIHAFAGE